jgi:Asp-tRNA(Asn)/Glu-tRNA(Gln) amidotransferase A subunit family amidase
VPCQAEGELPVGALVTGRRFDDGLVMAVGEAIERSG